MRFVPLVSCLAMACAAPDLEGACKDFVAATNGCLEEGAEAGGGSPKLLEPSLCEEGTTDAPHDELEAAVERYECKADAYTNADCRTADGFRSAVAADAACDAA